MNGLKNNGCVSRINVSLFLTQTSLFGTKPDLISFKKVSSHQKQNDTLNVPLISFIKQLKQLTKKY